ncbi:MAG TPA: amidohydrolase [Halieaceae bacterium]|nr:amidohydrolase [Halieaceae bacterium]
MILIRHIGTKAFANALSLILLSLSLGAVQPAWTAGVQPGEEGPSTFKAMGVVIPPPAPDRSADEGEGPFDRLVIENVMLVNGLGAPPRGPVSIVITGNTIEKISGYPPKPQPGERRLDGKGMTALPGFIDAHVHIANPYEGVVGPITPPEYVFKLWLGHGITTVRDTGSVMGLEWTVGQSERAARNEITAPDIIPYAMFPGTAVAQFEISSEEDARAWVRSVKKRGAKGVKLRGGTAEALAAVYDEAQKQGMGTASHHDQNGVYHMNVLDSARLGLDSMEHWYGLPEAMFTDRTIQDYPADYNYSDEQWRFGEAGNLWRQSAERGSETWQATIDELLDLNFTLVPTFTIYEANRDVMRERNAEWHEDYTLPALMRFFEPDPRLHGSYHFDWTTGMEVAWRDNFRRWMSFINDFKNAGGRVAAGSDSGFIYKLFGFGYIRELEMLQEAGFHPLEVVQAATRNGAELLGMEDEIGSISPGKRADIVLVEGNPVSNFKLLYGTGHMKLNRDTGVIERVGGVSYTVKDGVIYDAKALLSDVRDMVTTARAAEAR